MSGKYFRLLAVALLALALVACGNDQPLTDNFPPQPSSVEMETSTPAPMSTSEATSSSVLSEPVLTPDQSPPVLSPADSSVVAPDPVDPCEQVVGDWSTLDDSTESRLVRDGKLFDIRPGRHDCFDRVVLDVSTSEPVGFHVGYVPVVHQEGSGFPVVVNGEAVLRVGLDAWAESLFSEGFGFKPDWPALREIKFAGSFEGQTTLAIGVSHKTPFAVYHLPTADGNIRVVIDIAD